MEFDIYLSKIKKETITRSQPYAYGVENYLLSSSATCIPYPKKKYFAWKSLLNLSYLKNVMFFF